MVGKAVLEVNDPATPQITLVLKGVVKPGIEFLPYQAIFASVYKGESGHRSVRIVNNRERPLGITRVEQQGEHFHAGIKPVESGKLYELEVTVPATVPPGRYTEAVFLYTDDPTMPRLMVPVNVLVKPDLYANPETVDFGRVALKELADNPSVLDLLTQSVIVRKRAGNFSITNVTSDIPFVTIRRSPEGEGSSEVFRIDVALMKDRLRPGSISGSLRILTDDKQFPELIVSGTRRNPVNLERDLTSALRVILKDCSNFVRSLHLRIERLATQRPAAGVSKYQVRATHQSNPSRTVTETSLEILRKNGWNAITLRWRRHSVAFSQPVRCTLRGNTGDEVSALTAPPVRHP